MSWLWTNAETLAAIATIFAALIAVFAVVVGLGQYWAASRYERRSIAHEKLNSVYEIAIEYPDLASGRIDPKLFESTNVEDIKVLDRYTLIYSAIETTMEFLWINYKNHPHWRETIKYNMLTHREFVMSDYHRDHGWWSTYDSGFLDFLARDVFKLPVTDVRAWAKIEIRDDELDMVRLPTT